MKRARCQNRTPSVSLHPQFYSKACDDVWRGPMVLTGGVNEDGENHWLTMAEAEKLASSLNNGYPGDYSDGLVHEAAAGSR